ncbi:MAG: LamG domain-containing protein, partial [Armatimonadota bacterium]|nr:LamG domain-containing protein [Armatimonadota bacterium]
MLATLALLSALTMAAAQEEAPHVQLAEPFRSEYSGEDATGEHVIGLWQFNQPEPAADASGNGHELELRGGEFVDGGRFGRALRSQRGWPEVDEPHKAIAQNSPDLSPDGAFTVEMWIQPAEELREYPDAFLLDKRYIDDTDYQLILRREVSPDERQLHMHLGFGDETQTWASETFNVEPGVWRHIAFVYDGAGTGTFYVDGSVRGTETKTGYGRIAPGRRDLHIGDRVGSYYHGFPGLIDQVRICRGALEFSPARFELLSHRRVFVRMEAAEPLRFALTNLQRETLAGATARLWLFGVGGVTLELPEIASGERHTMDFELDTSLRPDDYRLRATVEIPADPPFSSTEQFDLTIVPRELPGEMPVVMWGGAGENLQWLKDIGFTHYIGLGCDFGKIWEAEGPTL